MTELPIRPKPFTPADLSELGDGLHRPECVIAAQDGSVYTGDWTLGIARIAPDGTTSPAVGTDLIGQGFRPNGIALTKEGDFLITNMARRGGVWRVTRQGEVTPLATECAGRPIPPTNFVLVDGDRTWITISATSRDHQYFTAAADTGQILLVRDGSVTLAADGLNWTNEVRVSPDGRYLYVNETFACRTTRFELEPDGSLRDPVALNFPQDIYPDGMAFDSQGGLWIACVISNRLIRVAPDLTWTIVLEDADLALGSISETYANGGLTWDLIAGSRGARLANLSSIAFGGPDLKTIYLGGLGQDRVMVLRSPIPGAPMSHWQ